MSIVHDHCGAFTALANVALPEVLKFLAVNAKLLHCLPFLIYKQSFVVFLEPYSLVFFPTGLMFVLKDANLRGLVVAERAVATKSKENEANCETINLLFKVQLDMLLFEDKVIIRNPPYYFKHFVFNVFYWGV